MMRLRRDYDLHIDDFAEGESKAYAINWLGWLDGAQITSSDIEVESDGATLTAVGISNTLNLQRFRLAGGQADKAYALKATINTSSGDTLKCSVLVTCRQP